MAHAPKHKFQMTLIAPEKGMSEIFSKIAKKMRVNLHVVKGGELNAIETVQNLSPDSCDVILARRIVARHLHQHTAIPVISVELSTLDLLRILQPYVGHVRKITLFRTDSPLSGVNYVAHALRMEIHQCIYTTLEELKHKIRTLERDTDLVIGGILAYDLAVPLGFAAINIVDEEEIACRAINDAIEVARFQRKERQWNLRLETLMNTISEGVIVLDEYGTVRCSNPAAERLLNCSHASIQKKHILDVMPGLFTEKELVTHTALHARVHDMKGKTLVVNRVPIIFQKKVMGTFCTFSDARHIQQAADNLRKKVKSRGFTTRYTFDDVKTRSPRMQGIKELGKLYASTEASLILCGESGTGKEVFAQSIHAASPRKAGPFVAVNCAAIPEGLLESELFGYEEGAFTGARRQGKAGLFEIAHTGTLLLDEVSDLPLSLQGRLLRVLQEKELIRVGGTQIIPLDVRVICATSRDLSLQVEKGEFRADLFYRVNILSLTLPPLRERPEDIMTIATPFLLEHLHRPPTANTLDEQLGPYLLGHSWPGNIRELRSIMERLVIVANCSENISHWGTLLSSVWTPSPSVSEPASNHEPSLPHLTGKQPLHCSAALKDQLRTAERNIIESTLNFYGQDIGKATKALRISRMTLWRKLTRQ